MQSLELTVFLRIEKMEQNLSFLRMALEEARKCEPTPTAFCVGCVITAEDTVLSTGYSRELPGNTHAEANALAKITGPLPSDVSVYTTMEPCSVRTSGLAPCANALIDAGIKRCYIGVGEPDDFVQCEGAQKLMNAGIEVIWLSGLEAECLEVARRGH